MTKKNENVQILENYQVISKYFEHIYNNMLL